MSPPTTQRTGGSISHTAFGIVALKQYLQTFPTSPSEVSMYSSWFRYLFCYYS